MRRLSILLMTSCLAVCGACSADHSPTSPTPPSTSTTVTAVNLSGGASSGPSFQLTAMARLSDGASQDVTSTATWASSNPSIATVSNGLVTVVGSGEVDVRATYQSVSGALHLLVAGLPVTALTITGTATTDRFQLTATARLSDGSTQNVTSVSTWESSNPAIATVSPTGLVTVLSSGETDIRATYRDRSASEHWSLSTAAFMLTGTVREAAPGNAFVSGATVRLLESGIEPATSAANGAFAFAHVPAGRMLIEVSRPGYEVSETDVVITKDTQLTISVYPTPPQDATGATATARCSDGTWSWADSVASACTKNGGVAYKVCPGALCGL